MAVGSDATSAGFNSAAIGDMRPLQIRRKSFNRSSHGMAAFDSFRIAFTANCTFSWHNWIYLKIALLVYQICLCLASPLSMLLFQYVNFRWFNLFAGHSFLGHSA
jgi:hypothetical protein